VRRPQLFSGTVKVNVYVDVYVDGFQADGRSH